MSDLAYPAMKMDLEQARNNMIAHQLRPRDVEGADTLEALSCSCVAREEFVPPASLI